MSVRLNDLEDSVWEPNLVPKTEQQPVTALQQKWAANGVVILPDFLPENVLAAYEQEWLVNNGGANAVLGRPETYDSPGGYPFATPYMTNPALKNLVCNGALGRVLTELIGEPMGVHLNLTGWVSTRRNWHRDQYLNDRNVGGFYTAVWIALDTVNPDAGPFEYIEGTHTSLPLSRHKVQSALGPSGWQDDWPTQSEKLLTPLFENEISSKQLVKKQFIAKRGDVLIWHGNLLHRGTTPNNLNLERRACIAHYSGIYHRPDMPPAMESEQGGWFFPLNSATPSGYKQEAKEMK